MKIIGYSWAPSDVGDVDSAPDETTTLISRFMSRKKWLGPVQLEDPIHKLIDFNQRPCGQNILTMLRGGDVLVVKNHGALFSKASQGIATLNLLKERGITVFSIDLNGDISKGKLFDILVSVLLPLKELEPLLFKSQAKAIKRRDRENGRYLGGNPPIGFSVRSDGTLANEGTRKKLIRRILRLKADGLSLRQIASELKFSGLIISHSSVNALLKSAGYISSRRGP